MAWYVQGCKAWALSHSGTGMIGAVAREGPEVRHGDCRGGGV